MREEQIKRGELFYESLQGFTFYFILFYFILGAITSAPPFKN